MEFGGHGTLTCRGKDCNSKWNVTTRISHFWKDGDVEKAILTLDPYWFEQIALSAHNGGRILDRCFADQYIIYTDGRFTVEDLFRYAKDHNLKCGQEFIGMK